MLARLATTALVGLVAHPVGVEVDIGCGLPAVTVVGLGDTAVLQARDRIRAAFGNAGFDWPDRRVTVSLPPSDLPKHGSGFDSPNVKSSPCYDPGESPRGQEAGHAGEVRRDLLPHLRGPARHRPEGRGPGGRLPRAG
jgi:hypothetical protein